MYDEFKERILEHIDEFSALIPYELTVSETFLVYSLILRYEELKDEYEDLLDSASECRDGCIYCKKNEYISHLDGVLGDEHRTD